MHTQIMFVPGIDGQVELLADRVIIHRQGFANRLKYGFHAKREIPLLSITSVNFREATFFKIGEIDFDYAGRSQIDRKQNTVAFGKKHQEGFMLLKEKIFELMNAQRRR